MSNLDLPYRPLRLGTSIINARVNEPGTIGLFCKDELGQTWLISCYHVLCDGGLGAYHQDEAIYQPAAPVPKYQVGLTDRARANMELDCAAALVSHGIQTLQWIPGLGAVSGATTPQLNMRVFKVGAVGGITEGVVTQISGNSVFVRVDASFPPEYVISEPGDSGSLWMEQSTQRAVALHRGVRNARTASATDIEAVLNALQLKL